MNHPETLLIPALLVACVAAGFTIHAIRHAGWPKAFGWLGLLAGMAWVAFAGVANAGVTGGMLLQLAATLLPLCVMMIPLLGMLVLAWLTGAQLARGLLKLTQLLTK